MAKEPEEQTCINNCMEKTYKAFELMMKIKMRQEANKTYESVVDISRYTEMDIETSHDTASVIPQQHGTHSLSRVTEDFTQSPAVKKMPVKEMAFSNQLWMTIVTDLNCLNILTYLTLECIYKD